MRAIPNTPSGSAAKWIAFAPVGGPPNCSDLDRGRRPGTLEDSNNFMKLAQFFNCVHTAGGASVDALDVHASIRHLHLTRNKMVFTDKVPFASSTGRHRLLDSIEIVRMARGIRHDQFLLEPSTYTVINTNSPLKLDAPMAMGIIEMARLNQICVVTPFTLAGAMAPITWPVRWCNRMPKRWRAFHCRSLQIPARPSSMAASPPMWT